MNLEDVENRVNRIREIAWDCEAAHVEEDKLYRDLIESIAKGTCESPVVCAALAYSVRFIDFERHCA